MRHWLIKIRKANGLTQEEAAKKSGISRTYYASIEQGHRNASGRAAKLIATALGFDMNLFFADVRRETSKKQEVG